MSDYNSGKTIVSGTVTTSVATLGVPCPISTQTVVNVTGTGTAANQNAYTVTAAKTFYLYGVCAALSNGAEFIQVFATDGTTQRLLMYGSGAAGASSTVLAYGAIPIASYAAGEIVKVKATNGKYWNVWGIEQ